jgi:hypothetical protein
MTKMADEREDQCGAIIAFRAPAELVLAAETAAAAEGISRSDIARRALMRALADKVGPELARHCAHEVLQMQRIKQRNGFPARTER